MNRNRATSQGRRLDEAATSRRPWATYSTPLGFYEIDVGLPARLPGGQIVPRGCKGIAIRKSGAAIAGALLRTTVFTVGPMVWLDGKFLLYQGGAFRPHEDDELRARLMTWDGMRYGIGTNKKQLSMSKALAGDTLSCLRDMLAAPSRKFFADASDGISFTNVYVTSTNGSIVLRKHSPVNRAQHWIDVPYKRRSTCRRFDRLLREVMMPKVAASCTLGEVLSAVAEAESKVRAFWEWLGVALLGHATRFGKALLLWGTPGSGKSTLLMIVAALWPKELRSSHAIQAFEDKFNRAELAGKRINICGELPAVHSDVVESFKAIVTGKDEIAARHPYERGFNFRANAAHLIAANRLPLIGDYTGAFFERFLILRADQKFRGAECEDHQLAEKIMAAELGAIAAKALSYGAEAIRRGRIQEPQSSKHAVLEWRGVSDSVRTWFGEMAEHDTTFTYGGIPGGVVYRVYRAWAESRGYRPLANNLFGEHMKMMDVPYKSSKYGTEWGLHWIDPDAVRCMIATPY